MFEALSPWAATLLLWGLFASVWLSRAISTDREIRELPTGERRALFDRTLETLNTTCRRARKANLQDYCRDQAALIVRFPECLESCRQAAGPFLPRGTK